MSEREAGEGRGLRDYLRQKARAMRAAAAAKPDPAQWRETVSATCVADDATGARKLRMGDWRLTGDSGPDFGGWGLGPSSPELFCGVVGACLTHTYLIAAATLDIPIDRVEVTVSASNNDAHFLGIAGDDPDTPFEPDGARLAGGARRHHRPGRHPPRLRRRPLPPLELIAGPRTLMEHRHAGRDQE